MQGFKLSYSLSSVGYNSSENQWGETKFYVGTLASTAT